MKYGLIVAAIVLVYCYIFRNYIFTKYRFVLYVGKPRSGKTTLMTKHAYQWLKKYKGKRKVYCNIQLGISGVYHFEPTDISIDKQFDEGSLVLIDEPNLYWDNRQYKTTKKDTIEWFRLYGHNKCNVRIYSQTFDIDKKLRNLLSDIFLVRKFMGTISICRRVDKNITIKDSAMDAESQIVDELKFSPWFIPSNWHFTFIPRWTKYFDSFYMPVGSPIAANLMYGDLDPLKMGTTPPIVQDDVMKDSINDIERYLNL